ncbi:beta-carotene 15,15'-dioxygenase, Brp/Blh family [Geodermatophilus sp. SYSU D00697]
MATRTAPSRPRRRTPLEVGTVGSLTAAVVALALGIVAPGAVESHAEAVLVAGLLLALPHGAVDALLLGRARGRTGRRRVGPLAGYTVLAVLTHQLFQAAPGPGLAAFVAVSVWHFGSGETAVADLRAGRGVPRRVTAALVLGSVVVLVPLARPSPEAAALVAAVVPGHPEGRPLLPPAVVPVVTGAAVLVVALLLLRRRRLEALEVAVLLAVALVLPPAAALGVYSGVWHAPRHVARLVAGDPAGDPAGALFRLARSAALPTATALGALLALWATADGARGLAVPLLPLLAALTLPHALVVAWLDRTERAAGAQEASRRIGTCGMPSST